MRSEIGNDVKLGWVKTCRIVTALVMLSCVAQGAFPQSFTNAGASGIPSLTNAKARWADFNNDNLLDVFISGTTFTGSLQTTVRINNGNNTFSSIALSPLTDIAVQLGDYDADGFIDIIMHGVSSDLEKHSVIYRNNNGLGFALQNFSLTPLSKGSITWHDLDHDMDLDIVMTGLDDALNEQTLVYEYKNDTYLLKSGAGLVAVSNGESTTIDVEGDGTSEVLITGLNEAGQAVTYIYSVNKTLAFTLVSNSLIGTAFNTISIADFNNDQRLDFAVSGFAGNDLQTSSALNINNGFSGFITTSGGLMNLSASSAASGDINHDGFVDLILTGHDDDGLNFTKYYRNLANGFFEDVAHTMPPIYNGSVSLGDYDNDGDLDVFKVGNSDISLQGNIHLSDQSSSQSNVPPSPPTGLESETNTSQVTLSWSAPTDDHTASADLTYNIYISTDQNGQNLILAPLSRIADGFIKIPQHGIIGATSLVTLFNLPEGQYFWSVQAVDQSFRGSTFASAQPFSICHQFSLGADTVLCYNDTLQLETGDADDVVDWYSKSTGILLSDSREFENVADVTDTIVAIVSKPFGCATRDTIVIAMEPVPDFTLGSDRDVCTGEQLTLGITGEVDSLNWFSKQTGLLLANAMEYTWHAQLRDTLIAQAYSHPHGCVSYDSVIVSPLQLPQYDLGSDQEVCFGQATSISVGNEGLSVTWKRLKANTQSGEQHDIEFIVEQSDTVVAVLTDTHNCKGYDSLIVHVLPLPAINLGQNKNICYNETTLLELPASSYALEWLNTKGESLAASVNQYSHLALVKDTIVAQATDNKMCVNRDSVVVDVLSLPQFSIGTDTAVCFGQNILLQSGAGYQRVDWYSKVTGGVLVEDSWFFNYNVHQTDTLIARVVNVHGCVNRDSIQIEQLSLPVFDLGNDIEVCDRQNVSISIPGTWLNVVWSVSNDLVIGDGPSLTFAPQQAEILFATVTGLNHCVRSDTVNVSILPLPVFDFGLDRAACENESVILSVSTPAESFDWDNGSGIPIADQSSYTFTSDHSKEIHLELTDAKGCKFRDSITVVTNPLPRFLLHGDSAVCRQSRVLLEIPSLNFQHVSWQTSEGTQLATDSLTVNVLLTESANVIATLTDLNGCIFSDTIFVRIRDLPIALAGRDTLLCFGEHTTLGGVYSNEQSMNFSWAPAQFLSDPHHATPLATPEHSITYTVAVENEFGCRSTDSVFVDVNPQINVDAGSDAPVCLGESISLGGNPSASGSRFPFLFEWTALNDPFESSLANPVVSPITSTRYYLFVSTGRCEVFLDSVFVTVNPLPVLESVRTVSIGAGGSVPLNVTGALEYLWSPTSGLDDPSSPSPIASPLLTTLYVVEGKDINGCTDTTAVTVLVQNSIFIPSLFTPNGDGMNDTFKLFGSGAHQISFTIFNSSGAPVYHTDNPDEAFGKGWDGMQNGNSLPNDVYVWSIEGTYTNGQPVLYEGKSRGLLKLYR
jgi:gliding motility-associated-like protein